jgi:hypothetical protein
MQYTHFMFVTLACVMLLNATAHAQDVDNDGVQDAVDACPSVVGPAPEGCPLDRSGRAGRAPEDSDRPIYVLTDSVRMYTCGRHEYRDTNASVAECTDDLAANATTVATTCLASSPSHARVQIVSQTGRVTRFKFLEYSDTAWHAIYNGTRSNRSWCAATEDFNSSAVQAPAPASGFIAATTILVPFKIRPSWGGSRFSTRERPGGPSIEFSSDVTLGIGVVAGGWLPGRNVGIGGVVGLGTTVVSIDESETRGALSFVVGGIVTLWDVQIGVLFGVDYLGRGNRHIWEHHRVPWVGVSFGIPIADFTAPTSQQGP